MALKIITLSREEWTARCVAYRQKWKDRDWQTGEIRRSGQWRVKTPDGADRPATGETAEEAVASVADAYDRTKGEVIA